MTLLYFDHAATSFPKAPGVAAEVARFLSEDAGNPGRGVHALAQRASDAVSGARRALAGLLGVKDARRLALLPGATFALNAALHGTLAEGQRVLLGPEAHNSVLRPLRLLEQRLGITSAEVKTDDVLRWDLDDLTRQLAAAPTALVVVSHASNVTGATQNVSEIVRLAHAHGAKVLVDAAQTAGALPLDLDRLGADLVAFSGHKGLLGPPGTGALYVASGVDVEPWVAGGTGTASDEEAPPRELPAALEAGTHNAASLAGLATAATWLSKKSLGDLHRTAQSTGQALSAGLRELARVTVRSADGPHDLPVVSFNVEGWDSAELAITLDQAGGVCVRPGLHCAPRAHRRLGHPPGGAVRASVGPLLEPGAVGEFLRLLAEITG